VIGGIGTVYGPILGALVVVSLEPVLKHFANMVPGVTTAPGPTGIYAGTLAQIIYGLLIVLFLIFEPRGLAGIAHWIGRGRRRKPALEAETRAAPAH